MEPVPKATKLMHISDLHLGKNLHGYSLLEDQKYILNEILDAIKTEKPDALIIAGDVYDKSIPREDAVSLFSDFLDSAEKECDIFIISGNHDSGRRLDFCSGILGRSRIFISGTFGGKMDCISLEDGYGKLNVFMLPYVKPSAVRPFFDGSTIVNPDDALSLIIEASGVRPEERNVLIAHQFFLDSEILPIQCESETSRASVGGLDCMSSKLLDAFDYAALGHIHSPQSIGRETVRYCGSPLKYSLSECGNDKSITIVELYEKNRAEIRTVPLKPLRDVAAVKGTFNEILETAKNSPWLKECYVGVILTEHVSDPDVKLKELFDYILSIEFRIPSEERAAGEISLDDVREKDSMTLFREFFSKYAGRELSEYQQSILLDIISEEEK